jgi:hypothetical protein
MVRPSRLGAKTMVSPLCAAAIRAEDHPRHDRKTKALASEVIPRQGRRVILWSEIAHLGYCSPPAVSGARRLVAAVARAEAKGARGRPRRRVGRRFPRTPLT